MRKNYLSLLAGSLIGLGSLSFGEPKWKIDYLPDVHKAAYQTNIVNGLNNDTNRYDGVLLEGVNFGEIESKELKDFRKKATDTGRKYYLEFIGDLENLDRGQTLNELASYALLSTFPEHIRTTENLEKILAEKNPEGIQRFNNEYVIDMTILESLDETKLTILSPGLGYSELENQTLYGIEDFNEYKKGLIKQQFVDWSYVLNAPILDEMPNIKKNIQNLANKGDPVGEIRRDEAVIENIRQLPGGKYLLIMGSEHHTKLKSLTDADEEIEFKTILFTDSKGKYLVPGNMKIETSSRN